MKMYSSNIGILAGAFGLILASAASTSEAAAQRGGPGDWRASRAVSVEQVIRLADELDLTSEQRNQLESIRIELLEMRATRTTEQMTLMSEIQAGIREREAVRQEVAGFAGSARETLNVVRERMQEILTEEQRTELRQLSRRVTWQNRGGDGRERFERLRGNWRRGEMDRGRERGRDDERTRGRGRRPGGM